MHVRDVDAEFGQMDVDGSGSVGFDEFCSWALAKKLDIDLSDDLSNDETALLANHRTVTAIEADERIADAQRKAQRRLASPTARKAADQAAKGSGDGLTESVDWQRDANPNPSSNPNPNPNPNPSPNSCMKV